MSTKSLAELWNSPLTHIYKHQVNSNKAFVEHGSNLKVNESLFIIFITIVF